MLMPTNAKASLWDGLLSFWNSPWAFTMSPEALLPVGLSFVILKLAVREGRFGFADWGYTTVAEETNVAEEQAQALVDGQRENYEATVKDFEAKARNETQTGVAVYDRACSLVEEAQQRLNDVELVERKSRQATELLLRECDGLQHELGYPSAGTGTPPPRRSGRRACAVGSNAECAGPQPVQHHPCRSF